MTLIKYLASLSIFAIFAPALLAPTPQPAVASEISSCKPAVLMLRGSGEPIVKENGTPGVNIEMKTKM